MLRYEYRVIDIPKGDNDYLQSVLNRLGTDHWELVSVYEGFMYFKRPDAAALQENVAAEGQNLDPTIAFMPKSGTKQYEAMSSMDADLEDISHNHMVLVVVDAEMKVVSANVQEVNGHTHECSVLGVLEESEGHTHTFQVN